MATTQKGTCALSPGRLTTRLGNRELEIGDLIGNHRELGNWKIAIRPADLVAGLQIPNFEFRVSSFRFRVFQLSISSYRLPASHFGETEKQTQTNPMALKRVVSIR
jgi:hypothetical protein